jgi:DNA-binding IclR family transcriptional regulator
VAGSIGVFGPGVRMKETRVREIGRLLVAEAGVLSRELGAHFGERDR